jgi:VWFA-related protein
MNHPRILALAMAASLVCAVSAMGLRARQSPESSQAAPSLKDPGRATNQNSPGTALDPQARIRTTVSLVVVPVTVKNGAGELVTELDEHDFRIFQDGIEQPIAQFSVEPAPLSIAVLIDDDLKRAVAEKVKQTLETITAGLSASDELSLWRFDEVPESISEFIDDSGTALTQLKRIDLDSSFPGVGSAPMTSGPRVNTQAPIGPLQTSSMAAGHPNNKHINDAIYAAADQLQSRPRERRKIVFIISDGQNAKNNTHTYQQTLKLLLSSDISVYSVGVGEANLNRGITFLGNNILAKYAHSTGGDIFYAASRDDIQRLYPRVMEQARHQYTIAYSAAGTDRSQPYHSIEVRVRRPGLTLLTRDGYYLSDQP